LNSEASTSFTAFSVVGAAVLLAAGIEPLTMSISLSSLLVTTRTGGSGWTAAAGTVSTGDGAGSGGGGVTGCSCRFATVRRIAGGFFAACPVALPVG
jgi:hypothetical protein